MGEALYQLQKLSKTYGQRRVVELERLDVRRGEILALVGPSGAGKSTLLRLLNFLEPPTAGVVRFLGQDYDAQRSASLAVRRRVTMVFQRPVLLNRNVADNAAYGLRLRGQYDARDQVAEALKRVGLADRARQSARTLSGGEMQRVSLARAMVIQPDALLLDEPTANLDPYNVGLIEDILRTLNRERQTTLVLVTHNVFQAHRMAHRTALMLEGKIVEIAPTEDFFNAPQDPRTAAFVRGEMVY